ncbi:hypothetical protein L1I30_13395 [Gillisia sp. M10.2A]|uniref:Glycosyltransferase RgtA/B/C/D-like domain-containing protein n=1 Tax=Gillisia lutea TaxID=2909668 RepID=A0ABS9EIJ3_9FLAO|nr:hypothetical protein [Gillisia lutea]MCF4102666.1 hypothetical protein [Gillisia lutea]
MNRLFIYHMGFGMVYYIYAFFNASDSHKYFIWPQNIHKGWLDFFGTETTFVNFISYPFINGLGFSYEMMMLLFTWFGFLGFVYAYLFFKENISLEVKVFKHIDLLTLILFLPNMHFWTASLGKGSIIFLGLMLFAYSIKKPKVRVVGLLIGALLVFYIRPHVFLLLTVGGLGGFFLGKDAISWKKKLIIGLSMLLGLFLIHEKILAVVHLNNSKDLISDFIAFTAQRSQDLNTASSGVNMAGYSLPEKFFTFWFRPLFFDAPGILGIIVSLENFIYLLLFLKILKLDFLKFLKNAPVNVRMSLVLFMLTSFAMTFVMSNLGIIIRQKSMVMYFLFFVIYYYLAHQKGLISQIKDKELSLTAA